MIDCVNGRFRIINDLMYSEYGDSIMLDDDGHILNGKSQDLDEVSSFTIGDKTFKRLKNRDAEQEDDGSASVSEPVKGYHMDVSTFTGELRSRIAQAIPNDPRGLAKKAQNLDLNQPFNYVHAQAVSLPEPAMADSRPQPQTEQERKEINAAENNNGNPVIK